MAYSYTISQEEELVYIQINETTQCSEMLNLIQTITCDPQFQTDYGILIEIRARYIPTITDLQQLLPLMVNHKAPLRNEVAIIAPNVFIQMSASIVRHFISNKINLSIRIFDDLCEAVDWLQRKHHYYYGCNI